MDRVIDEAALRNMPPEERRELARALAAIDVPHPRSDPANRRNRRIALFVIMTICVMLAAWIAYLTLTLPTRYTARHWRGVWVGLDIAELCGFAATFLASWKQRQILILFMIVTGTLLLCDAWFDVALSYGTSGARMSVIAALTAEIPLALLLYGGARRLLRITALEVMRAEGITGPVPPLWRMPLFADGLEEAVPQRLGDIRR